MSLLFFNVFGLISMVKSAFLCQPHEIPKSPENHIHIHTVQVGNDPQGEQELRSLAQSTFGYYSRLDPTSPQLAELWQVLQTAAVQRMLTYRSSRPSPLQLSVSSTAGDRPLDDTVSMPFIAVQPPQINIVSPIVPSLERTMPGGGRPEFDTPLPELAPNTVNVSVVVAWPDNYPRNLSRVEFNIGNATHTATAEPYTSAALSIAEIDAGDYTIRVRATDELGLVSDYAIQPLRIVIERIPRPAPPEIRIIAPIDPELERTAPDIQYNTALSILTPKTLAVAIEIRWPNNEARPLQQVEYTLGNTVITRDAEPFTEAIIPIEQLAAGEYTLNVKAIDQRAISGETSQPLTIVIHWPPPPPAPTVQIVRPTAAQVTRQIPQDNKDETLSLDALVPHSIPVAVALTWGDEPPRPLKRVEYTIGDESVVRTEDPFLEAELSIALLDQGLYTVQVRVIDMLDIESNAEQPLEIRVDRTIRTDPASGLIVFFLILALVALYIWYDPTTQKRVRTALMRGQQFVTKNLPFVGKNLAKLGPILHHQMTQIAVAVGAMTSNRQRNSGPSTATEVWREPSETATVPVAEARPIVARLVYLENGNPPQADIVLTADSVRFGRDPSTAHHVITDTRVSRLHCRFTQEANGDFRLWDANSAAGTYVEGIRISESGHTLQTGDIVGVGPVRYRFEILSA